MTNYVTVEGKAGIVAKVIAHSKSAVNGKEILTFEVQYPRMIHSEIMTHRMFSRNAASSRAIPFKKMCEQLTARPVRFGQANHGMQDKGENYNALVRDMLRGQMPVPPEEAWESAKIFATQQASAFNDAGYHKQVYNRLVEPFSMMKTIITATEWNNFFWLRDDGAADPTIAELARCMKVAKEQSVPQALNPGEWHLPFVESYRDGGGNLHYAIRDAEDSIEELDTEEAIKVSSARCAAVSFRNTDYDLEKSIQVYERLVGDERKHGSAMEHQATPIARCNGEQNLCGEPDTWQAGISHMDKDEELWSGNFCGWIQHRKLIAGENKAG